MSTDQTTQTRTPAGVPTGGQFAASARAEAGFGLTETDRGQCPDCVEEYHGGSVPEVLLCERHETMRDLPFGSDWHSEEPLERLSLSAENRLVSEMVRMVDDGHMTLDAPYQRGSVWGLDQRIGLVKSLLSGVPVPAVIVNDRGSGAWADANGGYPPEGEAWSAVVDGKQRVEAMRAFFASEVPVPSSWFANEDVETPMTSADGRGWVVYDGLSKRGQMRCENRFTFPVARGSAATVEEEAALYLLVNGAGTAQTDADMDNARQVAEGR